MTSELEHFDIKSTTTTTIMAAGEAATGSQSDTMTSSASPKPVSVLFVCLGNICRSTMAEGVFQSLTRAPLAQNHPLISKIDSCGTGAYHVGDSPDPRTMATLKQNGITSYRHAARKFSPSVDFAGFDYIFAMDDSNLEDLNDLRSRYVKKNGEQGVGKVMLFGEFGGKKRRGGRAGGEQVQDPYYGANDGFVVAHEQCVRFSKAFLEALEKGALS